MAKKITQHQIEYIDPSTLKPYDKNARTHSREQIESIAESIKEFGWTNPVLIDKKNGIIAGHGRVAAALQLGINSIPCLQLNMTAKQARAYVIGDNKLPELAGWDMEVLKSEIEALLDDGFDVSKIGFDDEAITDLFGVELDEGLTEGNEVPDVREETVSQKGDIWILGNHRIICGDSADAGDVSLVLDGSKANIVFTDPPYGVSIGKKNKMLNSVQTSGRNLKDIKDDDLKPEKLKEVLLPAFQNIRSFVMADDCTVFVTAPQNGDLGMMMMMMMKEADLGIRHVLIWKKNAPTFSMGHLDYDYQHEPILLTWGKKHKRPMKGEHRSSVWDIDKPKKSKEHPTMKPVELVENALLNNSDKGDIVYDAYSGSGTTIIAAQKTGRKARVVEIDPQYVDVAVRRWQEFTGEKATLESSGKTFEEVADAR